VNAVARLGAASLGVVRTLGRVGVFAGWIGRVMTRGPRRHRRMVLEVYDVGVLSLVIVCLSGTLVGGVLGLQGYNALVNFGAEESLGALVGLSLMRELGPVVTGLLVTGRAGSAMAAEIATMVTTEQLDGLRMMSIDPVDFVVTPKAVAMLIAMPLLTGFFIVFAFFGGYVVGVQFLGIDSGAYVTSLEGAIDFGDDVGISLVKAVAFGALVGLVATFRGFTSEPTSAGVSAATTGTVVVGSVAILAADYVITALWGI